MLFTEVQRSVRLNKKKKSTNISPYPDEVIDRLARAFYSAILACWNSEEGQREFAAWQAEQAHHATNEKQEVPTGELPAVHIALSVAFGRVRPCGRTLFLFIILSDSKPSANLVEKMLWLYDSNETRWQRNYHLRRCVSLNQPSSRAALT